MGWLILAATLVRICFGTALGLGVDESYMVAAGRVPGLGYFDHPPASWWLSWGAAQLAGTEAPIVVRLAVASNPWPQKSGHAGLEEAAAVRLSAQLVTAKPLAMAKLKLQAGKLFGAAVVAYANVRVLEAPGLHGT